MLSHMRGHIADMDALRRLCGASGVVLIEDCAHTMPPPGPVKSGRQWVRRMFLDPDLQAHELGRGRSHHFRPRAHGESDCPIDENCARWNERYHAVVHELANVPGVRLPELPEKERFVASSIQFNLTFSLEDCSLIRAIIRECVLSVRSGVTS
jgi:DegT/DnrJ/EryC1/StrS aminotransferase family